MSDISKEKEMLEQKIAELNKEKESTPQKPVNIFSKPLDVTQSDEAQKSRLKGVIIEALLFGAFLTAITAIYSISGIELKLDPAGEPSNPSIWFFLAEFIFFTCAIGVGNYYLTEHRVNEYNQKMAGISFDLDAEIEQALELQAEEGITEEDAMAINKSNGEEEKVVGVEVHIKACSGSESLTDKSFEAYIEDEKVGDIACCKAFILDNMGIEQTILRVYSFNVVEEYEKYNVGKRLFAALKDAAMNDNFAAIVLSSEMNRKYGLCLSDVSKYNMKTDSNDMVLAEVYPGALMGISGELKIGE